MDLPLRCQVEQAIGSQDQRQQGFGHPLADFQGQLLDQRVLRFARVVAVARTIVGVVRERGESLNAIARPDLDFHGGIDGGAWGLGETPVLDFPVRREQLDVCYAPVAEGHIRADAARQRDADRFDSCSRVDHEMGVGSR